MSTAVFTCSGASSHAVREQMGRVKRHRRALAPPCLPAGGRLTVRAGAERAVVLAADRLLEQVRAGGGLRHEARAADARFGAYDRAAHGEGAGYS